jgi:3'-5' exoribonuclease
MKPLYVADLEPDQSVTSFFLVWDKEIRRTRDGKSFLRLELGDRTGTIEARMWENFEEAASSINRDDFVKVQGRIELYRERPQIALDRLRKAEPDEIEPRDFFPHTAQDIDELSRRLAGFVAGIRNPWIGRLLAAVLADREIAEKLKRAPAAKMMHHAYLGGLLEHIVSLCGLCLAVAGHYPELDADLLLAGALLHDLGKIDELSYGRSLGYTTEGRLLGHIAIGLAILRKKIEAIEGFPPPLAVALEHIVLSHHGQYEFGSPTLPAIREAVVFHYLDDLDSKMGAMRSTIEAPTGQEEWTEWNQSLSRHLLRLERYLNPEKAAEGGATAASAAGPIQLPLKPPRKG